VSGNLVQSLGVITAPKDELIKKRSERLLWICNDLIVFHLFQYFFHGTSVYLHNRPFLVSGLHLQSARQKMNASTSIRLDHRTSFC
jgi:hypothetical protein